MQKIHSGGDLSRLSLVFKGIIIILYKKNAAKRDNAGTVCSCGIGRVAFLRCRRHETGSDPRDSFRPNSLFLKNSESGSTNKG